MLARDRDVRGEVLLELSPSVRVGEEAEGGKQREIEATVKISVVSIPPSVMQRVPASCGRLSRYFIASLNHVGERALAIRQQRLAM